ncbi:MAG: cbb3-type cytochrome c oxidase subunit III [Candidatus Omnitrophota bacterium]|jgi:cbb3-type cytochrome c oxidase subunit III
MSCNINLISRLFCIIGIISLLFFSGILYASEDAKALYQNHCARCHGDTGEGDGVAYTMQRPWPRNFKTGDYKFRSTPLNSLPTLKDIETTIAKGNLRTSMPPFESFLTAKEISLLAEYVLDISKTNSKVPVATQELPYDEALNQVNPSSLELEMGQKLFYANCVSCHGDDARGLGDLAGFLYDENNFWIQMPDLTDALAYGGGHDAADIKMRMQAGIALSNMPVFNEALSIEEIDRIALYVKSLQKKSAERQLISQAKWRQKLPKEARGEYMTRAMSCALCHNSYDETGMYDPEMYMAGGVKINLPGLGAFYTKNITSHTDGLAKWTEEEIIEVMTTGYAPDRRIEAFSMPWVFFSHLDRVDAEDIAAYIKNLEPIQNEVPDRFYYPIHQRLGERFKELLGLEYGRLEYPPFNQGRRDEPTKLQRLDEMAKEDGSKSGVQS